MTGTARIGIGAALGAVGLLLAIVATPLGSALATTMVGHVLVQIPLLVAVGFALGRYLEPNIDGILLRWNAGGIPGILLASFAIGFWMIPRWLDGSLTSTATEAAKYASLVLLAGLPLAWSWARLHPIARGVVKIEFLAMLFRLGWLYLISPDRLCNSYLLTDQTWLGRGLVLMAIALSITWLVPVFFGDFAAEPVPNRLRQQPVGDDDPNGTHTKIHHSHERSHERP